MRIFNFIKQKKEAIAGLILLALIIGFFFTLFEPKYLFLNTTTTGGDTAAHNYLAKYLKDNLLSQGKVVGWAPGWWAGFPMFQYYFFFPYLLMALLGYLIPLGIAFKIISVLGIFALPVATYWAIRMMHVKSPGPSIGAVVSLAFLFVNTHTMWGGNVYSTLAGEIAHSLSFPFGILFVGYLYQCMREERYSLWLSLLFALVVFTHLTTALVLGFGSLFFLFTRTRERFMKNLRILTYAYGLAFLLTAFWGVPLLAKIGFSIGFGEDWGLNFFKTFPLEALAYLAFSVTAILYGVIKRDSRVFYILAMIVSSLLFYRFGYYLNLVDIRFWPPLYFFFLILAAIGISFLAQQIREPLLIPFILLALLLIRIEPQSAGVQSWSAWNFSGYEKKPVWNNYKELVSVLDHTPGRAANDLADYNNTFGSPRVFENIPYFVDKPIIEGGIIQSGLSSIFTMYIQCETSHHCAGFPRIVTPTEYNLDRATKHLELFNVKHIIAYYDKLRADLARSKDWKFIKKAGEHEIYELMTHDGSYVFVPKYEPVLVKTRDWKTLSLDWFYNIEALDLPLVLTDKVNSRYTEGFKDYVDEPTIRKHLLSKGADKNYIYNWLFLGTFKSPRNPKMDFWEPASDNPFVSRIDEAGIEPTENLRTGWKRWKGYYSGTPFIDLGKVFSEKPEVVVYASSYIYSPSRKRVKFWYGSDDGIKIWLNGTPVAETHLHRGYSKDSDSFEAELQQGMNRVLVMVENVGGRWGFSLKITDTQGSSVLEGADYQDKENHAKLKQMDIKKTDSSEADKTYIYDWLTLGTFKSPRNHKMDYWDTASDNPFISRIDEARIEPTENLKTGWKAYRSHTPFVDLGNVFIDKKEMVAYASSYIYSPSRKRVKFWYGSDDGVKIWLNGVPVAETHLHRGYIKDSDNFEAELRKGMNRLLVMVENVEGAWGFSIKITDAQGAPVKGLKYKIDKEKLTKIKRVDVKKLDSKITDIKNASVEGLLYQMDKEKHVDIKQVDVKKIDNNCSIKEKVSNQAVEFDTSCVGKPHIIKISYYPNWKVEGADRVYRVSPAFMLVYPNQSHVRLYYGFSASDLIGSTLSWIGLAVVIVYSGNKIRKKREKKP